MSKIKFVSVLLSFWLVSNVSATPDAKYLKEVVAGYTFGAIGWCVGTNLANAIWDEKAVPIGGFSLYGLGSSIGVWVTGKQYDEGKYLHTLVGTVSLPLIIMGISAVCGIQLTMVTDLLWMSVPMGSFIGYNFSIKKEKK